MFENKKGPGKGKPLGKVHCEQMSYADGSSLIIERIPSVCEKCNGNKYYYVFKRRRQSFIPTPMFPIPGEVTYEIVCGECGEKIELDFEEYEVLRPIIGVNNKLEKGKISEMECRYRVEEILKKLKKSSGR